MEKEIDCKISHSERVIAAVVLIDPFRSQDFFKKNFWYFGEETVGGSAKNKKWGSYIFFRINTFFPCRIKINLGLNSID